MNESPINLDSEPLVGFDEAIVIRDKATRSFDLTNDATDGVLIVCIHRLARTVIALRLRAGEDA